MRQKSQAQTTRTQLEIEQAVQEYLDRQELPKNEIKKVGECDIYKYAYVPAAIPEDMISRGVLTHEEWDLVKALYDAECNYQAAKNGAQIADPKKTGHVPLCIGK